MMKKTLILAIMVAISGCSVLPSQPQYKVPDGDVQRIIFRQAQANLCLNSDKKLSNYSNQRVRSILGQSLRDKINKDVLREKYIIIGFDMPSQEYFTKRYNYFFAKMENEAFSNMSKDECLQLRKFVKAELKKIENELKKQEQQELVRQKRLAKEEKARQAFYATPQGQAYLAQQKLLAQQQAYQQQMLEAQRAQQARQETAAFWASVNQSMQGVAQSMQNNANMINQMNYQNSINQMNRSLNNINNNLQRMSSGGAIQWYNVQ